ncbi:hypothetical protein MMC18_006712 [Xylographa bjoerkii]|nr:hypothetical protein [Xylographa bjoerkii]
MGEPFEGESPYEKLTEEEVLAEDAARRGAVGPADVELGGGEEVEGKGKGKGKVGAEGAAVYDEESDWEQGPPEPVDMDEEMEELRGGIGALLCVVGDPQQTEIDDDDDLSSGGSGKWVMMGDSDEYIGASVPC